MGYCSDNDPQQIRFHPIGGAIKGAHAPHGHGHTNTGKCKQQETDGYKKPAKDADDKVVTKKQKPEAYDGQKIPVHMVIRAKITAALPDRFRMKKSGSSM